MHFIKQISHSKEECEAEVTEKDGTIFLKRRLKIYIIKGTVLSTAVTYMLIVGFRQCSEFHN